MHTIPYGVIPNLTAQAGEEELQQQVLGDGWYKAGVDVSVPSYQSGQHTVFSGTYFITV